MTLSQYRSLSYEKKCDTLWNHGVYLASHEKLNHLTKLYSLFSFLVEVRSKAHKYSSIGLRFFENYEGLEKYYQTRHLDHPDLK